MRLPTGLVQLRENLRIDVIGIPRWYVRLWRWVKLNVLRIQPPPPPTPRTITKIDHATRTVTFE